MDRSTLMFQGCPVFCRLELQHFTLLPNFSSVPKHCRLTPTPAPLPPSDNISELQTPPSLLFLTLEFLHLPPCQMQGFFHCRTTLLFPSNPRSWRGLITNHLCGTCIACPCDLQMASLILPHCPNSAVWCYRLQWAPLLDAGGGPWCDWDKVWRSLAPASVAQF